MNKGRIIQFTVKWRVRVPADTDLNDLMVDCHMDGVRMFKHGGLRKVKYTVLENTTRKPKFID